MHCFILDLPLNFTMCSSMHCSLSFNSTSKHFKFRWSITGLILKFLSVLSSFVLSAKYRFWKMSQKCFRVIVFWISSLPMRLSTLQYWYIGYSRKCFQFFVGKCEVYSILISMKIWSINYQFQQLFKASHQRNNSFGKTVSFRLGCISGKKWHSSCLVTFTFLVFFHNSFFCFCSFLSSLTDCHLVLCED